MQSLRKLSESLGYRFIAANSRDLSTMQEAPLWGDGYADPVPRNTSSRADITGEREKAYDQLLSQ